MNGYLIDTCAVSESVKPLVNPGLAEWIRTADEDRLFLSVLTLGELRKGVEMLGEGKRKESFVLWLEKDLWARFRGRILSIDREICEIWGRLSARFQKAGRHLHVVDGLLAATALAGDLYLVTRNISDFEETGVSIENPWR